MKVIELRNYLLKPGRRSAFNDYFSAHFVESQAVRGGHVLGKFAVDGHEDKFFWVRGFRDMATRGRFLPEFYGGPVWKEFGSAANEMMIDSDDVYLLKPLDESQVFKSGEVLRVDYFFAKDAALERLIEVFHQNPSENTSLWTSEPAENDFPALPVFQYENLLVAITSNNGGAGPELQAKIEPLISKKETLLLSEI